MPSLYGATGAGVGGGVGADASGGSAGIAAGVGGGVTVDLDVTEAGAVRGDRRGGLAFADALATGFAVDVPGTPGGAASGRAAEIAVDVCAAGAVVTADAEIGISTRDRWAASIRCAAVRVRR